MQEYKNSCVYLKSKLVCPICGSKLGHDKKPFLSERGFIYRNRICISCRAEVSTKQMREEITHVEAGTMNVW